MAAHAELPIALGALDVEPLARAYAGATPFRHVVLDDFADASLLEELAGAFEEEPAENIQDEIFDVMASGPHPEHAAFRRLQAALSSERALAAVGAITGREVTGVDLRGYAYLPGHYLLPHADRDDGGKRQVAFAFYVALLDDVQGGELDLYAATLDAGVITAASVARTIEPRANRCVLFEVSPSSLHRVREVTAGARLSVAGWFTK